MPGLADRVRQGVKRKKDLLRLFDALAEHMGAAARDPANLSPRPCPVCERVPALLPREPELVGPVYAFHRCPDCSLLYAPAVLRPDVTRRLYGERPIYRQYWEYMRADAEAMQGREVYGPLIRRLLPLVPARDVALDVGCGFGKLLAELAPHFREAVGFETNRRTAQAGARLYGVSIRVERLERHARPSDSVDLILLNQVLEHLADVRSVVRAARRLLKPGGVLWIGIPHGDSVGMRLLSGAHPMVATHMHVNMFSSRALLRLAEAEGFELHALGTDDDLDLSAADWAARKLPARWPLLAMPAFAFDQAVRRAARASRLPSRLNVGAHLEATLVKPR